MNSFISLFLVLSVVLFHFVISVHAQTPSPTPHPTSVLDPLRSIECLAQEHIRAPGSILKYLNWRDTCIRPTLIVIHYTGEWSDTDETIATLNDRRLGCQLATSRNTLVQLLNFYQTQVERAGCAAGYNNFAIHNEISGVDFDAIIDTPTHPRYDELIESSDTVVSVTCWLMKQYNIPKTQVFGHHELTVDKPDPGPKYMHYFRARVQEECL